MKRLAIALCASGIVVGALPASAALAASPTDVGEANVALVQRFLAEVRAAMAAHDAARLRAVVERYMDAGYIQHSDTFGTGRQGYIDTMTKFMTAPRPAGEAGKDLNFVGNRQFVTWMSEMPAPDGTKRYLFNTFRIENGKLKEHWSSGL